MIRAERESDAQIRPFAQAADYEACLALQRATWGEDFRELVPPALLQIAQRVGGIAAGAFDSSGRMLGFVFGLTGVSAGEPVHWSHMLAVREDVRDRGIGQQLKRWQRAQLCRLGVRRMLWTYDPLVARNAHLNLNKLGAKVVEYVENMYGVNPLNKTDSVIGTDRFIVEWRLDGPDVQLDAAALVSEAPIVTAPVTRDPRAPQPNLPAVPEVRVEVPADIQRLKLASADGAVAWRLTTRRAFTHYLPRGYAVVGVTTGDREDRRFYVLRRETTP